MEPLTAASVALAFNQQNQRPSWTARANSRDDMERVHFSTVSGMVKLVYDVRANTFHVQFNKVHAAWGDYIRAIARGLYVVLTTLKSAGLPFDAPPSDEGVTIRCLSTSGSDVIVAYEAPQTPEALIMSEQRLKPPLGLAYSMGATTFLETMNGLREAGARFDGMDGYDFTDAPHDKSRILANIMSDVPTWVGDTPVDDGEPVTPALDTPVQDDEK